MSDVSMPAVFIGSSGEARDVARHLQAELEKSGRCVVQRWDNAFRPGEYTLEALTRVAAEVDFAVLVATPDDVTLSRGDERHSPRDNVIFEAGLFMGAIGRRRTFLLPQDMAALKLPSDLLGLTLLPYTNRADGDHAAAVNRATLEIEGEIKKQGAISRAGGTVMGGGESHAVQAEIASICRSAVAQGWVIKINDLESLRLQGPRGQVCTLSRSSPGRTREEIRRFAAELRAHGLRLRRSVRRPVSESPFG